MRSIPDSELRDQVASAISKLTNVQVEALRRSTFDGMTEEDVREYQHRAKQLHELVNKFRLLMGR